MSKVLVKQPDGTLIPVDESVIFGQTSLGRGSRSLKKRVVKVGNEHGMPVYKLVPLDEVEPQPTPQGPMTAKTPKAPPTTSQQNAPVLPWEPPAPSLKYPGMRKPAQFNLGVDEFPGDYNATTAKERAELGNDPRPVAPRAKASQKLAEARKRAGIVKKLKPAPKLNQDTDAKRRWEERQPPKNQDTDAKRRWEERYKSPTSPEAKPLDLSLPPPPPMEAAVDPLAKFRGGDELNRVPMGGNETPPEPATPNQTQPDPFEKYKVPVSSRESDLPEDEFGIGKDPVPDWAKQEPVDGVSTFEADGDLSGNLRFGPDSRDFNESGEPEAPQVAGKGPNTPFTPITGSKQTTTGTTTPILNQSDLNTSRGIATEARETQGGYLAALEKAIGDTKRESAGDRQKYAGDRATLLANYTQGLDDVSKAKFMDTIIKNIGKVVAGGVGLHKGLDVAKHYNYEGADTEGMRKDVGDAYKAGVENLDALTKAKKDETDKEFEQRKALLDAAIKLPESQQRMINELITLQRGTSTTQSVEGSAGEFEEGLRRYIQKFDGEELERRLKEELEIARLKVTREGNMLDFEGKKIGSKALVDAANVKTTSTDEKSKEVGETTSPQIRAVTEKMFDGLATNLGGKDAQRIIRENNVQEEIQKLRANPDPVRERQIISDVTQDIINSWRRRASAAKLEGLTGISEPYEGAASLLIQLSNKGTLTLTALLDEGELRKLFDEYQSEYGKVTSKKSGESNKDSTQIGRKVPLNPPKREPTPVPTAPTPVSTMSLEDKIKTAEAALANPATPEDLKKSLREHLKRIKAGQ